MQFEEEYMFSDSFSVHSVLYTLSTCCLMLLTTSEMRSASEAGSEGNYILAWQSSASIYPREKRHCLSDHFQG